MIVDFSQVLMDVDGTPLYDGTKNITLSQIAVTVLKGLLNDEQDLPAEERVSRWQLANKIHNKSVDLTDDELSLLKRLIGKGYLPGVVGPAFVILTASHTTAGTA